MKKSLITAATAAQLLCSAPFLLAADVQPASAPAASAQKFATVDFKRVVEESKYGKREQANFEGLKKQMETVLDEKEKALSELESKFNDPDYVDSLSATAEEELKNQFRTLSQEIGQIQAQYYQTLNQANMLILQQLGEIVSKAAEQTAKENGFNMILSNESGFYFDKSLDLSSQIIAKMNDLFEKEQKDKSASTLR